jgi:hypothetical protein
MDSFFREGGDALFFGARNCRSAAGSCCSREQEGEGKVEEGQFAPGSRKKFQWQDPSKRSRGESGEVVSNQYLQGCLPRRP